MFCPYTVHKVSYPHSSFIAAQSYVILVYKAEVIYVHHTFFLRLRNVI